MKYRPKRGEVVNHIIMYLGAVLIAVSIIYNLLK